MTQATLDDIDTDVLDGFSAPEDACVNWENCENSTIAAEQMCGECLDEVRHQGAGHGLARD